MSIFRDFGKASSGNAAPVTTGLVIAIVGIFLLAWTQIIPKGLAVYYLGFNSALVAQKPWSLLTFPFASAGTSDEVIGILFLCWWLWFVGGAVERDLGPGRFLTVWAVISVLCALCVWLGAVVLQLPGSSAGAWTCVAGLTVMWGTRNPSTTILLMFIIPISGKWLAWLSAALVFFQTEPHQLAPFAAFPLLLAYLFAANKLPVTYSRHDRRYIASAKKTDRYDRKYYEEVRKREQERAERERLRKLFESSVNDDDKK